MSGPTLVIFVVLVQRDKRIESLSQGSLIHNFGVVPEQKPHPFGHIARTGVDTPGRNGVVVTIRQFGTLPAPSRSYMGHGNVWTIGERFVIRCGGTHFQGIKKSML